MKNFYKWIKDAFSEPDCETVCIVRVLATAGFIFALVACGWNVFLMKAAFDVTAFGTAYGVMLASLGVALGIKTDTKKVETS